MHRGMTVAHKTLVLREWHLIIQSNNRLGHLNTFWPGKGEGGSNLNEAILKSSNSRKVAPPPGEGDVLKFRTWGV